MSGDFRYGMACCFVMLLSGALHGQSCADYFQAALEQSAELTHAAEFRVRMGTVVRGRLRGEQLFGAGSIAHGEKGDTLEATANFHWVRHLAPAGQYPAAAQRIRREKVRLSFAREGRRVVIRITGGSKPVLLEPRCNGGLVYAEDRGPGGIATWVFHFPFVNICCATTGAEQHAVVTQHNDMRQTGAYMAETVLTPQTVKRSSALGSFGLLRTFNVVGQVYAQPLYVPGVKLKDGTYHNLLYVATATNTTHSMPMTHSSPTRC